MTEAEITELLFVRDPLARSDLAIVFGHHDPDIAGQRARHGAALFRRGYTPRLLLTGGPTGDDDQSEAELMAAVARDEGVPETALLLEGSSRTTAENISLSVALLDRENLLRSLASVHLVSCPWHMRRVCHLTRAALGPAVRVFAAPHDERCNASTWASSPACVARVLTELRLVRAMLGC